MNMAKTSLTFIFSFISFACFAQEDTVRLIPHYKQTGFLQLDYQSIKMPDGERNMGFSGIHYNLDIGKLFYGGFGFYGSVSGERGGFFTLGVNAGLKLKLVNNLLFDTGVHLGGGGGASAPRQGRTVRRQSDRAWRCDPVLGRGAAPGRRASCQ